MLWGNFSGVFELNQTNLSIMSGVESFFNLNLLEGYYIWNVECNDTIGNSAFNGNQTFVVDISSPVINLVEPVGQKTSKSDIDLEYYVSDLSPVNCSYNVSWSTGSSVISDTSLPGCSATTFDLSSEGDYVLYLTVADMAGNSEIENSSFSVFTPSNPPEVPSGGGGGGGGSGSVSLGGGSYGLDVSSINAIVSIGEEKSLSVSVENKGIRTVNRCRLVTNEGFEDYVESDDLVNIGGGEIVEFSFILNALDNGVVGLELNVACEDEDLESVSLEITVLVSEMDISLESITFDDENLMVGYLVESTIDAVENLRFKIVDSENGLISEFIEVVSLAAGQVVTGEVTLSLSDAEGGMVKVSVEGEDGTVLIEESVIYEGGGGGITGFAVFGGVEGSSILVIIILFVVVAVFIVRRMLKSRR